jgi:hypothetical protein
LEDFFLDDPEDVVVGEVATVVSLGRGKKTLGVDSKGAEMGGKFWTFDV